MPYNANIPQPTNRLRNSQNDLLQNFMAIDTGFSLNHMGLNEAAGVAGKHKLLTMPVQSPAPGLPSGTDLQLYTATSLSSTQIFLQRSSTPTLPNVPKNNYSWTGAQLTGAVDAEATKGYTYLPSGLLMQWDNVGGTVGTEITFTFPVAYTLLAIGKLNYNIIVSVKSQGTTDNQIVVGHRTSGTSTNAVYKITPTGPAGTSVNVSYWAIGY